MWQIRYQLTSGTICTVLVGMDLQHEHEAIAKAQASDNRWKRLVSCTWEGGEVFFVKTEQPMCGCKFVAVGQPLDPSDCLVHEARKYPCPETMCPDYRPAAKKLSPTHWPKCVCGEIAQQHNCAGDSA